MAKIKIASVAMMSVADKAANLEKMKNFIDDAAKEGVSLISFPELCLPGLAPGFTMMSTNPDATIYWIGTAEVIPEGDSTQALIAKAKQHNMYISWTMVEQDRVYCDRFYNTHVLVGPEGFVGKHSKAHLAGTERLYFYPGKDCNVYDTTIGKIGMVTCIERNYPELSRCLKLAGAEIVIAADAWPGLDKSLGEKDPYLSMHKQMGNSRAVENAVVFVDSNAACAAGITRVEEGLEVGHARIVSPEGIELASTGWEEGVAMVEIDPQAAIKNCFATFMIGNSDFIKDLRPDIYLPFYENYLKTRSTYAK